MIRPPPKSTLFPYTTLFRSDPDAYVGIDDIRAAIEHSEGWRIDVHQARPRPAGAISTHHVTDVILRAVRVPRSEEHTSELQSRQYLVCRLLLEKKNNNLATTSFVLASSSVVSLYFTSISPSLPLSPTFILASAALVFSSSTSI